MKGFSRRRFAVALGAFVAIAILAVCILMLIGPVIGNTFSQIGACPPPGCPSTQPAPTTAGPFGEIDKALATAVKSSIAYNAPDTMQLNQPENIKLLINPSASPQELATQIAGPGPLVGTTIDITPLMKAELVPSDPEAFTIQPLQDNPVQVVGSKQTTHWQWSVTPKKGGPQRLTLTIYRQIKYQGTNYWRSVKTYESSIDVQVTFGQRLAGLDWKWILGMVVAFGTAGFWRWWDGRKKKDGKKEHPARSAGHAEAE